jgi:hypothetical protein
MRWLALAVVGLSVLGAVEGSALAEPQKVEWSQIDVPPGDDAPRIAKVLRAALEHAARKANFGKAKRITLSAKLVAFRAERRGDVLQVSCTAIGRLHGGARARSKISFGGSPEARGELEKEVLTMVANGLVGRLAQIARTSAPKSGPDP